MEVNPLNFLGLAILGAALLWAVHLVYSARRAVSGDTLQILLLLAGWLLLVGGVLGVCAASGCVELAVAADS